MQNTNNENDSLDLSSIVERSLRTKFDGYLVDGSSFADHICSQIKEENAEFNRDVIELQITAGIKPKPSYPWSLDDEDNDFYDKLKVVIIDYIEKGVRKVRKYHTEAFVDYETLSTGVIVHIKVLLRDK